MEIHQEKRSQYECEQCDKSYATKFSLSRHVRTHSRPQNTPVVKITAKKTQIYHCEKCNYLLNFLKAYPHTLKYLVNLLKTYRHSLKYLSKLLKAYPHIHEYFVIWLN